ncbi:MAG: hypothetical protein KAQ85_08495 [Thermodesulfovibrionia bacterium]|nr:hypothetical protein [Thermodesulfovibrionia bacterium]
MKVKRRKKLKIEKPHPREVIGKVCEIDRDILCHVLFQLKFDFLCFMDHAIGEFEKRYNVTVILSGLDYDEMGDKRFGESDGNITFSFDSHNILGVDSESMEEGKI